MCAAPLTQRISRAAMEGSTSEDDTVEAFADVYEAALRVDTGLGAATGFSETCFQAALASELPTCQREVVRPVPYYCKAVQKTITVGHVRFDIVYKNVIVELKSYRTKCRSTGLPQALHAQLSAYKRLLEPGEVLLAVLFWKSGVDVFEYT